MNENSKKQMQTKIPKRENERKKLGFARLKTF